MRRGLMMVLAVAIASCGGPHPSHSIRVTPPRGVVPGSVPMSRTPESLLAVCLANTLLHPICPRLGPAANGPHTTVRKLGICEDRRYRDLLLGGHYERLASGRCVLAGWGYEASAKLPFNTATGDRLSAWNGEHWVPLTSESGLFPPPLHVHVEIQAARRGAPTTGWWPTGSRRVSDASLTTPRSNPVSLGWRDWYGTQGQLILEPNYPAGGEWGGHLVYRFTATGISYVITLHAWVAALRVTGDHSTHVVRLQPGPALPHVIATLKTIVGSALTA